MSRRLWRAQAWELPRSEMTVLPRNRERGSYGPMLAAQCKMARDALGLGARELATMAGVSPDTVYRLEKGDELLPRTVATIRAALEGAGAEFLSGGAVRPRGPLED